MSEAKISQADLARACGVKPPSVSGWLSGKSKFLRGENLLKAARALNVSQQWLADGTGPMRLELVASAIEVKEPSRLVPKKPGTRYLVALLAEKLRLLDPVDRSQAQVILAALASKPEDGQHLATKLERLLGEPPSEAEEDISARN